MIDMLTFAYWRREATACREWEPIGATREQWEASADMVRQIVTAFEPTPKKRRPWHGGSPHPAVATLTERIKRAFALLPEDQRERYARKLLAGRGRLVKHAVVRLDSDLAAYVDG